MLRSLLLYLSERKGLQNFILRRKLARRVAHRFVAGETLDTAIAATRDLNSRGMLVTLDHLGESVGNREQADQARADYIALLDRIGEEGVEAGISIKLTQIGLAIDKGLCGANLRRIAESARDHGTFVRIDMEGSEYTQATLDAFYDVYSEFKNVGAVVQSYLRRTEDDVRALAAKAVPVRLCKGAYKEPEDVAFQKPEEVDDSYLHLLEILMKSRAPVAAATHDSRMIEAAKRMTSQRADGADFEFQMLYGVRRDLQAQLVDDGFKMRVYVPYGTEWYPYFMRRMAERPANMLFVLRAIRGR